MSELALISDIHGNGVALDAVLADLARRGVGQVVCLGDLAAGGPHAHEVIARVRELGCPVVRGNADRWLLEGLPPGRSAETRRLGEVVAWARARLAPDDLDYLAALPPTLSIGAADGPSLFCFHGSPRADLDALLATTPEAELDDLLAEAPQATLNAAGHTHLQLLRRHRDRLVVNPGSVGLPLGSLTATPTAPRLPAWAEYALVQDDGCGPRDRFPSPARRCRRPRGSDGGDAVPDLGRRPRTAHPALERAGAMSGAGETGALGGLAVDRLPLRPLPALRWRAPGLGEPGGEHEVVAGEQRVELGLGEEVNQEPSLRAGEVADGEAAVAVPLDDVMVVLELGANRVRAQTEKATRRQTGLGGADVVVGARAVAVLEDLDADDEGVGSARWERAQLAVDQAFAALGRPLGEPGQRRRRDVEADEVEAGLDERQVVSAVAAADVEALGAEQVVLADGGEDVSDERQRRLVAVPAGGVLDVPSLGDAVELIPSRRHRRIVSSARDENENGAGERA
jgi:predicted phosphodiesterase